MTTIFSDSTAARRPDAVAATPLTERVVGAVRGVVGGSAPLHAPEIGGNAWAYVKDCLDTEWVSTVGAYVDRFEAMLREITGARHAVATMNGTAALHVCLILTDVRPGEEVMAPALSFVATVNAIAYAGAVPHFVDCEAATFGMDADKLARRLDRVAERRAGGVFNRETGRRIAAILPVHIFGHAGDLDALLDVAGHWGLPLVEDAAESLGTLYKGRHTGTFGRLASLSFNGNKIVTTGGGGAILTDDPELGRLAKHVTTTAKRPHAWEFFHDSVGYNYRLPNLNAALGCAQLEALDSFVERKRRLAQRYAAAFAGIGGVSSFVEPAHSRSNYWLNVVLLDPENAHLKDPILAALNEAGLMSRPAWTPLNRLPMYAAAPADDLNTTDSIYARLINLPSSARLGAE